MAAKLIRAIARAVPQLVFKAEQRCRVNICIPSSMPDRTQESPVLISNEINPMNDMAGMVLPFDVWTPVHLEKGEKIFAVANQDTFLSMSVEPLG